MGGKTSRVAENNGPTCGTAGTLYLVATPIGNLGDISHRAADLLGSCDLVACEDTRRAGRLLNYLGISKTLFIYHEHNESTAARRLSRLLSEGKQVALISAAGTPAISDPGFRLVRECRRRKIPVVPVPGPSAAIAALAASGLPSDGFLFLGFLPSRRSARLRCFERFADFEYSLIFYESRYRIRAFVDDLVQIMGPDRYICVARELTKLHETITVGSANEVRCELEAGGLKGEFVVVVAKKEFTL